MVLGGGSPGFLSKLIWNLVPLKSLVLTSNKVYLGPGIQAIQGRSICHLFYFYLQQELVASHLELFLRMPGFS